MDESLSPKKALEDLNLIKETINRSTGASMFTNFVYSTGTILAFAGLHVIVGCILSYYLLQTYGLTPKIKIALWSVWAALFCFVSCITIGTLLKQAKAHDISLITYYKRIAIKTFIQIDIPLETMCFFFSIYFIKSGQPFYILPTLAMWIGVLLTSLGVVYLEKSFQFAGYVYLISGGIGLIFLSGYGLAYAAVVFGIFSIVHGLLMHNRYKQLLKEHSQEDNASANDQLTKESE